MLGAVPGKAWAGACGEGQVAAEPSYSRLLSVQVTVAARAARGGTNASRQRYRKQGRAKKQSQQVAGVAVCRTCAAAIMEACKSTGLQNLED